MENELELGSEYNLALSELNIQENDIFICTHRLQAENYAKSMKNENSK